NSKNQPNPLDLVIVFGMTAFGVVVLLVWKFIGLTNSFLSSNYLTSTRVTTMSIFISLSIELRF
ncbi:MAG: hypothetical protein RI564_12385, partial [Gracilimonas sp.]|nr:hypothetical protein [Gracilimonas sp.]